MLRIILDNKKVTFEEALNKQFEIFQIFAKHGAITHIRGKRKKYIAASEITKDYIRKVLAKKIQLDLADLYDLNSSRIGFGLWLPPLSFGRASALSIRFGSPKITGNDVIILDADSSIISSKYSEVIQVYYNILFELIFLVDPTDVIFYTHELKQKMEDEDYDYGFIMYKRGERLKELGNGNGVKLDEIGNGYLWKADFGSYENGLANVVETWKPELATV